jgi:hypothetical protein
MGFYIASMKWTPRGQAYITFWRPNDCGYAWPLSWAGKYDRATVLESLDYYHNGQESIAVACDAVDALAAAPAKGMIDGDAGPVVLNTPENWRVLLGAVIQPPLHKARPKAIYFGRNAA